MAENGKTGLASSILTSVASATAHLTTCFFAALFLNLRGTLQAATPSANPTAALGCLQHAAAPDAEHAAVPAPPSRRPAAAVPHARHGR
eukprot:CAMPEP_0183544066 /NCGR_PEP_ID=MMETSP0371-20130417/47084_1 /TAXON_ID=268820 /ORGANISM="Peridinium aciculiferum, Strain PAER-2" /LENGTH=88 /DNA_ID=CAMNT_0025745733 /DNA_START=29 /DNA_END=293 /DNA_ORIENTATION=-